ncbi:hypothetical protein F0562_011188 [Nyssa sinensis]|uniref:WRKY domain-containing protein n=1 Tax=Nyssa sinensis TaxID=561372 RepID=A0A5J5A0Z7_9ASTE|nr:hypothetical protein F0562_011188 [Nyssa sinensis]
MGTNGSNLAGRKGLIKTLAIFLQKLRIKRKTRVQAVSNKLADIPPDDYTWRKYGQKPIKGSPHPRCEDCLLA